MEQFNDSFMLPPESSIQDAFDGIEHWTKVIPVGTKYSTSMSGNEAHLIATWQVGFIFPTNIFNPFDLVDSLVKTSKSEVPMFIGLKFTETMNGVNVDALLLGALNRGMGDYRSLKTHLLTGSGIPDRAFDRYLTEQTKTPPPEPEWEIRDYEEKVTKIQQGISPNCCPHCNSEVSISGVVRPDGSVVCPKCFKRFRPS